jgi:hypothetical protein
MNCRLKMKVNLLLIQETECEVIEDSNLILMAYYFNTINE